jgi:hypothetical protein
MSIKGILSLFLGVHFIMTMGGSFATTISDVENASADEQPKLAQSAPIKIANRWIINLKGPLIGLTAEDRMKGAKERIDKALHTNPSPAISIESIEEGRASRIMLDNHIAFVIAPIDIDASAGETTDIVAREVVKRLDGAIKEWREQRTTRYMMEALGWSLAATLIFALALWLLFRIDLAAGKWMTRLGQIKPAILADKKSKRFFPLSDDC